VLYSVFVFAQTVRHQSEYFAAVADARASRHRRPFGPLASTILLVSRRRRWLAKQLAPARRWRAVSAPADDRRAHHRPHRSLARPRPRCAPRRESHADQLNLALGSALATIGLTIPAVAVLSVALGLPLELGLAPAQIVLLALTMLLSAITLASGRATVLHGAVHLVVFAAFLVLAFVPWPRESARAVRAQPLHGAAGDPAADGGPGAIRRAVSTDGPGRASSGRPPRRGR
jgi:Ca2+:H+ antiporter